VKNKILTVTLLILFMIYPVYATTPFTIVLNGINYAPKYPVYEDNKMLYVSMDDFLSLTYGSVISDNKTYTLSIQNDTIKFTPNERIAYINTKLVILANMPSLKDQIYLPINLLDSIKYPYTLNKDLFCLTLVPIPPYSRTTDSYEDHVLTDTKIEYLSATLQSLVPEDKVLSLLATAKKDSSYISFIDNTDKDNLLNLMRLDLLKAAPRQLKLREIDSLSSTTKVSSLKTLPLKIGIKDNNLTAEIGQGSVTYNCIWAAYKPDDKTLKVDVSKSLDATLMRMLYEYYRDQYDLKDDLYFSPVTLIKNGRADSIVYTAYSDSMTGQKNIYDVIIYRTNEEKLITYTIDLILHH